MSSVIIEAPSAVVHAAAQSNIILLAQGAEMIDRLGSEWYDEKVATCFNSTAGGHFRHTIEHYQALLASLDSGKIDYEGRARDVRIETDSSHARDMMDELSRGLENLIAQEQPDRRIEIAAETVEGQTLQTSLGREMEFLISHTVHHYALIAVIAGVHGVQTPMNFGMAPSTLKHQQNLAATCAR